ncbi:MAG: 4Fe-4S binding protein [Thermincola ferriacetica]
MAEAKILKAPGMAKCIGCYSCMLACARVIHNDYSPRRSAIQIRSTGGLQSSFLAVICRGCLKPACAEACPAEALVERPGGGVIFKKDLCTGCRKCVAACSAEAIFFDEDEKKPIVCIQCGTCTRYCPHQVITMEVRND